MPLKDSSSSPQSLIYEMSIEFDGFGTPGKRRTILKYNDVISGDYRRVDFVAEPSHEWTSMFNVWSAGWFENVSMTIRHRNETLLTLSKLLPTYYALVPFPAGAGSMLVALMSVSSKFACYARSPALAYSQFEHYLPASTRANVRLKRG